MKLQTRMAVPRLLALSVLTIAAGAASAHQIWFEGAPKDLTFRYGELDKNLHEVSPGGMDRFVKLETNWISAKGEKPVALEKKADRMDLPGTARPAAGDSLVSIDKAYPMFDTQRDGKAMRTYWMPATRWVGDFSAREPVLTVDIVPTGQRKGDAVEFRVTYLGEALAGEKLKLATPSGWTREATSDTDGRFHFVLPWRGDYAINLYFIDEASGVRKLDGKPDEAYQLEGYNSTLSFHIDNGLDPLPTAEQTLPASVLLERGITPPKH